MLFSGPGIFGLRIPFDPPEFATPGVTAPPAVMDTGGIPTTGLENGFGFSAPGVPNGEGRIESSRPFRRLSSSWDPIPGAGVREPKTAGVLPGESRSSTAVWGRKRDAMSTRWFLYELHRRVGVRSDTFSEWNNGR